MAFQEVNIGVEGNDGTGDSIRQSFRKVNENFNELYAVFDQGGRITLKDLDDTAPTYRENSIFLVRSDGLFIDNAILTTTYNEANDPSVIFEFIDGSISVDPNTNEEIYTPGELRITAGFSRVADDTLPTLGGHLDANNFAIAGVTISDSVLTDLNRGVKNYRLEDLVITKGYADIRYLSNDTNIVLPYEPEGKKQYTWEISDYIQTEGALKDTIRIDSHYLPNQLEATTGHGLTSKDNGLAIRFDSRLFIPQVFIDATTEQIYPVLYIRVVDDNHLYLYVDQDNARAQDLATVESTKLPLSQGSLLFNEGTAEEELDTHVIVTASLDQELSGNFLADQPVPRKSVVLRGGDTMTGPLYLSDHPGDLKNSGAPNGPEDLQAATKLYVDQGAAYSSPEVLFVSSDGDDSMEGVPGGREGTAAAYAFRTIGAAAARANELIQTSAATPGPYIQRLTYTNNNIVSDGTVLGFNIFEGEQDGGYAFNSRTLLQQNRTYIQKETIAWINQTYPEFSYDASYCERDIGLLVDAIIYDIYRGIGTNTLTKQAAERYYSSISGRRAVTVQQAETLAAIEFARQLSNRIILKELPNSIVFTSISKATECVMAFEDSLDDTWNDGDIIFIRGIENGADYNFLNGQTFYIKFLDPDIKNAVYLFTDDNLLENLDTSSSGDPYGNDNLAAEIGKVYQRDYTQLYPDNVNPAPINEENAVDDLWSTMKLIIGEGVNYPFIPDTNYGKPFQLYVSNGTTGFLNQTSDTNADAIPGKVIRGTRSEAIGRIIRFVNNDNDNDFGADLTRFDLNLLSAKSFEIDEPLEYANYIKLKEVVIRVEAGNYYEDYPIKVANNVSIKGDEFRRVIVQPKVEAESHIARISQSRWATTYFYRDKEFDGLQIATNGTSRFYNQIQNKNTNPDDYQGWFGYHYLVDPSKPINIDNFGTINVTNPSKNYKAAEILQKNKDFFKNEIIGWINDNIANDVAPFIGLVYDNEKCARDVGLIVDALVHDFTYGGKENTLEIQGSYHGSGYPEIYNVLEDNVGQVDATVAAMEKIKLLANTLLNGQTFGAAELKGNTNPFLIYDDAGLQLEGEDGTVDTLTNLIDLIIYAFDINYNPPKRTDEMDVFLLGDTTIIRNVTCRGHGGFMSVLDPDGQILTKSPYIQTASSFSKSTNEQRFSGGMFVDAYTGNLPARILHEDDPAIPGNYAQTDEFKLPIISDDSIDGEKQGLKIREPQLPCPFYIDGVRYQVNAISDYEQASGFAFIYLDKSSGPIDPANPQGARLGFTNVIPVEGIDIFLQTAGNRSLLGNDYTQVNDLGYGLVVTNGAFSEMVSMFTYYCHAAYYSCNGGEIRSLNGSNGYGNFALVSEGADPNEIPDRMTIDRTMCRPATIFAGQSVFEDGTNASVFSADFEDSFIVVQNLIDPPQPDSIITIDHLGAVNPDGNAVGVLNYRISAVSCISLITGEYAPSGINKTLYRLELRADDVIQTDYFGLLQNAIPNGTHIEYRDNIDLTFEGVANPGKLVTRPSTAINMDESSDVTYRSLDFQTENPYGNPIGSELLITLANPSPFTAGSTIVNKAGASATVLETNTANQSIIIVNDVKGLFLPGEGIYLSTAPAALITTILSIAANKLDKVRATIEQNFETVVIETYGVQDDGTPTIYMNGGCGSTQGDTYLAIKPLPGPGPQTAADRIINPDSPKVFTFKGKNHRVTGYFNDVTELNINANYNTSGKQGHFIANGPNGSYTAYAKIGQTSAGSDIIVYDITGTFQLNDQLYVGTDLTNLTSAGVSIDQTITPQEYALLTFEDADVNATAVVSGLADAVKFNGVVFNRILNAGLEKGAEGEITVAISLLRATGHDFTQIGTGGYNTSNYPNVILGDPLQPVTDTYWTNDVGFQSRSQVWEKKKGRVFWVSTDQYGFFRVGRFFSVDQGTGSITFGGEVGISNANALGFKKGVTINEFSSDEGFADDSNLAVPTEKAIRGYIKKILGIDPHNPSIILTSGSRIGPGFLPLNGTVAMEGDLNMGVDSNTNLPTNRIKNVGDPLNSLDAVNKNYVDARVGGIPISKLKNFMIDSRLPEANQVDPGPSSSPDIIDPHQFLVSTGKFIIYLDSLSDVFPDGAIIRDTADDASPTHTGVVIQSHTVVDPLYGSVRRILYSSTTGDPFSIDNTVGGSIYSGTWDGNVASINGTILPDNNGGSFEEITNAGHYISDPALLTPDWNGNDIIVSTNRTTDSATINFAIREDSIINADVKTDAGILQSKLAMSRAPIFDENTGNAPETTGWNGTDTNAINQSNFGLAAFSDENFDIEERTDNNVTYATGRVRIKANGIALGELQQITSARVLGRVSTGTGNVEELTFSQIAGGGGALLKSYFPSPLNSSNQPLKSVLVRTTNSNGGEAADWSTVEYANSAVNNSIAQRTSDGALKAAHFDMTGTIKYNGSTIISSNGAGVVRVNSVAPGNTNVQVGTDYLSANFIYTTGISSLDSNIYDPQSNTGSDTGAILFLGKERNPEAGTASTVTDNDSFVFWTSGAARYKMTTHNVGTTESPDIRTQFYAINASDSNPIDLGSSANRFSTVWGGIFSGYATRAKYGDLAENYLADEKYETGTVLVFGGAEEITVTNAKGDKRVAGVVSTNPAHLMNEALEGEHVTPLALQGRVPCKVIGKVAKGDMLVTSAIPGYAIVDNDPRIGTVLGKAVGEKTDDGKGVVEIVVGRL